MLEIFDWIFVCSPFSKPSTSVYSEKSVCISKPPTRSQNNKQHKLMRLNNCSYESIEHRKLMRKWVNTEIVRIKISCHLLNTIKTIDVDVNYTNSAQFFLDCFYSLLQFVLFICSVIFFFIIFYFPRKIWKMTSCRCAKTPCV